MNKPLFDSDILCIECGYWYTPEAFLDSEHVCAACRRRREKYKQQIDRSGVIQSRLRQILADLPQDEDGTFVYLLVGEKTGLSKIGYSSVSPIDRLISCQVGSPDILRYVGCLHAPISIEKELHELFKPYHSHGEWFALPYSIMRILTSRLDKSLMRSTRP